MTHEYSITPSERYLVLKSSGAFKKSIGDREMGMAHRKNIFMKKSVILMNSYTITLGFIKEI